MFGVMLIMLCGILVGYLLRDRKAIPAIVSKASLYIIFLLLFIMGVSIGSNPQVIHKFGELGFWGIAIALVSTMGSVALSWVVYRYLFKKAE